MLVDCGTWRDKRFLPASRLPARSLRRLATRPESCTVHQDCTIQGLVWRGVQGLHEANIFAPLHVRVGARAFLACCSFSCRPAAVKRPPAVGVHSTVVDSLTVWQYLDESLSSATQE